MYRADTIVAPATAPGRGAVAIVRVSGPEAGAVMGRLFSPTRPGPLEPWKLRHGDIVAPSSESPEGIAIDQGLCVWMPGPASYTGEDVFEIQCHGSPWVVGAIVDAALFVGARAAERGEFTRRAVLNGKLDAVQAEGIADLIDSDLRGAARLAWSELQGALSQRLDGIREAILIVLADVEANVDFSDEELPEENVPARFAALAQASASIDEMLQSYAMARRAREGLRVALVGRPNVGKSSLANELLGSERMIVTSEAGTTRDSVEELLELPQGGLVLVDTAGLRETDSEAETLAIDRARAKAAEADLVILVLDGSKPLVSEDLSLLAQFAGKPENIVVVSKIDLPPVTRHSTPELREATVVLETSVSTKEGCDRLRSELARRAAIAPQGASVGISRSRHRVALERAQELLQSAELLLRERSDDAAVAMDLRAAAFELESIVRPLDNEEVLDRIFGEFCIGK